MTSIIISHKLNEISYVADKITVIRDGSTIETLDKKKDDFSEQRIIQGMVGREMTDRFPKRPDVKIGDVSMEVKNWNVYHPLYSERKVVDNVSFKVHKGEVVGISGLMGAGRTEIMQAIFGNLSYESGTIEIDGKEVKISNPRQAMEHGIGFITEDRKTEGLMLDKSIRENISLCNLRRISKSSVISREAEKNMVAEAIKDLHIKCFGSYHECNNLSGGNQQKVILGRWLLTNPEYLILDEPTRGIDIGTKTEIQKIVLDLADQGMAVTFISSEVEEMLRTCSRMAVLRDGEKVGELEESELSQANIMKAIAGGDEK